MTTHGRNGMGRQTTKAILWRRERCNVTSDASDGAGLSRQGYAGTLKNVDMDVEIGKFRNEPGAHVEGYLDSFVAWCKVSSLGKE